MEQQENANSQPKRMVTVAAVQFSCSWVREDNIKKADEVVTTPSLLQTQMVRKAANSGANIILIQELFETPYFCQVFDRFGKITPG
jgi:N-carbamoylputrescine amidase